MLININTLLRMTNEEIAKSKGYFLRLGFRVFVNDDGSYSIMRNAAIMYVRSTDQRKDAVSAYQATNAYEKGIQFILLGALDEEFDILKEVYK